MGADRPHSSGGILQHGWVSVVGRQPVAQHKSRHTEGIQPARHRLALVVGMMHVAATGTDDDGRAAGVLRRHRKWSEARPWGIRYCAAGGTVRPEEFGGCYEMECHINHPSSIALACSVPQATRGSRQPFGPRTMRKSRKTRKA